MKTNKEYIEHLDSVVKAIYEKEGQAPHLVALHHSDGKSDLVHVSSLFSEDQEGPANKQNLPLVVRSIIEQMEKMCNTKVVATVFGTECWHKVMTKEELESRDPNVQLKDMEGSTESLVYCCEVLNPDGTTTRSSAFRKILDARYKKYGIIEYDVIDGPNCEGIGYGFIGPNKKSAILPGADMVGKNNPLKPIAGIDPMKYRSQIIDILGTPDQPKVSSETMKLVVKYSEILSQNSKEAVESFLADHSDNKEFIEMIDKIKKLSEVIKDDYLTRGL